MKKTKTLSFTSGKGGVGKTTLLSHIAYGLGRQGASVLILDGDWGMANVDILFNMNVRHNINDVVQGRKKLQEAIVPLTSQVDFIAGGSGLKNLLSLSVYDRQAILNEMINLPKTYDFILIDTAPGLHDNVLFLNAHADEIVIILTPDASSLADSYALIKTLYLENKVKKFTILCNEVKNEFEGLNLYKKFNDVTDQFLNVGLDYLGSILLNDELRKNHLLPRLILEQKPGLNIFEKVVQEILIQQKQSSFKGVDQFWHNLVGIA